MTPVAEQVELIPGIVEQGDAVVGAGRVVAAGVVVLGGGVGTAEQFQCTSVICNRPV